MYSYTVYVLSIGYFFLMENKMRRILLTLILLLYTNCSDNINIPVELKKPKISYKDSIISIIKQSEGFSGKVYKCPGGHLTKGYGRICNDTLTITELEAEEFLYKDIEYRKQYISKYYIYDSLQIYTMVWVLYAYKPSSYRSKLLDSICDNNINYLKQFIYYTDSTGNIVKSTRLQTTVNKIIKLWNIPID